jgi:hypothetical protein
VLPRRAGRASAAAGGAAGAGTAASVWSCEISFLMHPLSLMACATDMSCNMSNTQLKSEPPCSGRASPVRSLARC